MPLARPRDDQPHYGEHLGDPQYWGPYVQEVIDRNSLPNGVIETPFVGTFPTFIVDEVVVKLFGPSFDGERSSQVELAMHELLATERDLPVPGLIASGQLFDAAPGWPYLVTERMPGRAIRDVELDGALGAQVATQLGAVVNRLHQLRPPDVVRQRELLGDLRNDAPARLRRFGLPEHLVEQVPDFLADAEPAEILVHGDITADHVFVDRRGITALIDWGDALVADRAYELPAVYLDALRGDQRLLAAFLDAARWPLGDLARCGLQGILVFQFNAITAIAADYDLTQLDSLEELADHLFTTRDRRTDH